MFITSLREKVGRALLREAAELAFDQQAFERSLASVPGRAGGYGNAESVVAMARWVDSALLWLGMHVHPSTIARSV